MTGMNSWFPGFLIENVFGCGSAALRLCVHLLFIRPSSVAKLLRRVDVHPWLNCVFQVDTTID
jgi:hypothetical protein